MAQIQVDDETRDYLRAMKQGSETYDDVINRLLDEYGFTYDLVSDNE